LTSSTFGSALVFYDCLLRRAFPYVIDFKVLIQMGNARQRYIFAQLLKIDLHACGAKTYSFGGIADTQHTYAFARDETPLAKRLQGIRSTIMAGYHAEAGRSAIHGV
jgi:hypothetical protein